MRLPEIAFLFALFGVAGTASADPIDLKPFRATYRIEWKGWTAGTSVLELRQTGPDTYEYSSTNTPRGVFRLGLPDSISQASTFRMTDGHVQPLSFRGSDEKERPIELKFDWTRKRVTGVAKEHPVDLALTDGAQDPMTLQIASLRNLAAATLQGQVWLVDSDKLKEYELRREGTAQIETDLGTVDTIVYTSQRAGADRLLRTWVAPSLGYLPVKAERVRKTKVEFSMYIESSGG